MHENTYLNMDIPHQVCIYENWFQQNTSDVWRNLRMLKNIDPFLKHHSDAKWLTIGDGRFGTSAMYINQKRGNAFPTDIDISLLEIAKQKKWISAYKYANAENLPFADNEYDFAFCKEAFHHFPRAYIAIYEMIRITKKAVILIEPSDWLPSPFPRRILQLLKNSIRKGLRLSIPHPDSGNFEPDGNYIFTLSNRDITKIAMGLNLPCIAYKNFHDVYFEGAEYEKLVSKTPIYNRMKKEIQKQKILTSLGLSSPNTMAAVLFKELPDVGLKKELKEMGFNVINLPRNPYLSK